MSWALKLQSMVLPVTVAGNNAGTFTVTLGHCQIQYNPILMLSIMHYFHSMASRTNQLNVLHINNSQYHFDEMSISTSFPTRVEGDGTP